MKGVDLAGELDLLLGDVQKKIDSGDIKKHQLDLYEGKITPKVLKEANKHFEKEMNSKSI